MTDASRLRHPDKATPAGASARVFWLTRGLIAVVFAVLVGWIGIWLEDKGFAFVDTFDKHVGDLPIAYGSTVAKGQRGDIAVVLITEDTLAGYDARSPVDRRLIAELVRAIDSAGPKAIGVNFIFDRTTPHDADLIQALRQAQAPVVLSAIDDRTDGLPDRLQVQDDLLRAVGRPYGHNYFARKKSLGLSLDSVVRSIAAESEARPVPPFADVLAKAAGFDHKPSTRNIAWLRPVDERTEVFAQLFVPSHPRARVKEDLAAFVNAAKETLRGRVVLIGASLVDTITAPSPLIEWTYSKTLTDMLQKSLRFLGNMELYVPRPVLMGGTVIHAQAVAQRIDRTRDVRVPHAWQSIGLVSLAAFACFTLAQRRHVSPQSVLYNAIGLVVVCIGCLAAYKFALLELPSIALATAWTLGGAGGSIAGVVYNRLGVHH